LHHACEEAQLNSSKRKSLSLAAGGVDDVAVGATTVGEDFNLAAGGGNTARRCGQRRLGLELAGGSGATTRNNCFERGPELGGGVNEHRESCNLGGRNRTGSFVLERLIQRTKRGRAIQLRIRLDAVLAIFLKTQK
uniref:Uncharacterized protein n=1 Tax=Oryza meridionalis TaxID=40149 RepID=A0A0E0F6W6_9ORYZ